MNQRMNPWAMTAQPAGWGPPPPPRAGSSGLAKGCAIAAVVVVVLIAGACVAIRAFGPSLFRHTLSEAQREVDRVVAPIQRQAEALGRVPPDLTTACGQNSPRLQRVMPCDTFVGWLHQNAPFVPGATVRTQNFAFRDDHGVMNAQVTAQFSGPDGAGALQYALTRVGSQWAIDSVRLTVDTSTP